MSWKKSAKKGLKVVNRFFKKTYWIFYGKPVVAYKKLGCPAINDFRIDRDFVYRPDGYYPAILRKGKRKIDRIYKRVVDFDNHGLPMLRAYEQKYWPVTIAQFGLLNYNLYLTTKDEAYKQKVLTVCEWLIDNLTDDGMWAHNIRYHCTVVDEDIEPPYASAMVQGEGISLLVRGYSLSGDCRYLDCAAKALAPYHRGIHDRGVLEYFHGIPFYEEYPTETPSLVLNGFMFSLYGLYDLSVSDHNCAKEAGHLFDNGYRTLTTLLPMYDGGFCSRYDLSYITKAPYDGLKNPLYHHIHINQLIAMNSIRTSGVLEYYIREWK